MATVKMHNTTTCRAAKIDPKRFFWKIFEKHLSKKLMVSVINHAPSSFTFNLAKTFTLLPLLRCKEDKSFSILRTPFQKDLKHKFKFLLQKQSSVHQTQNELNRQFPNMFKSYIFIYLFLKNFY